MPNLVDAANTLVTVLQRGLVVSGNPTINVKLVIGSGDLMMSIKASGLREQIFVYPTRTETDPKIGGVYNAITDYVRAEILVLTSGTSQTRLRTRVDDFKITIASGTFTQPPRPYMTSENWPTPHTGVARAVLEYRFRHLE